MLFLYLNGADRTSDVQNNSIEIANQIQQRADSMRFTIISGAAPSENQDVKLFSGDTIASAAGAVLTLNGYFERSVNHFYEGQILFIRIGDVDEEKCTVLSYDESTLTLTLTAAPSGMVSAGDKIGELKFAGVVTRPEDRNITVLSNIEYDVTAVDYTKIFDHKVVADSWADVDSRYIINDFCNTTVNYNSTLDRISYLNNTAIQAEWIESGTGNNPTVDTSDYLEGTSSGVFSWTGAGTAIFTASPTSRSVETIVGAASGAPTKSFLMLWLQPADYTKISSVKLRMGSDASNYAEVELQAASANTWAYKAKSLKTASVTGTPDWTQCDYIALVIAATDSSSIKVNGFRLNAENSFTLYNVEPTLDFTDFRSPQLKPTDLIQTIAKAWGCIWYIDYERDIHFLDKETLSAPFSLSDSSNNFTNLTRSIDQSQCGNRVIVRGGEKTSDSTYAQVIPGDNAKREWVLKNKFNNLVVRVDDNSLTSAAEVGTNTTNIKITAHGLTTGDHIINRSRNNAVREITVVDPDNFTVEAVASQTNGDTISHFKAAETIGVEGLADETAVAYVYNSNEKSVRAVSTTTTLKTSDYIRFQYNERVPIQVQKTNTASANSLKALGFGDGLFDLDPITDRNIQDVETALALANAKLNDYSNPIITGAFSTDKNGLKAGQQIQIQDTVRGLDTAYLIQRVTARQIGGQYTDYFEYNVEFGTTLYGIIEFYQKLLKTKDAIESNTDDLVDTYIDSYEEVDVSDVNSVAVNGGFKKVTTAEVVGVEDVNNVAVYGGDWKFEPSTGQPLQSRFDLASYS